MPDSRPGFPDGSTGDHSARSGGLVASAVDGTRTRAAGGVLSVEGLVKTFGAARANDGIDLAFSPGEVNGLLGENGAGKSTLVKVLAGIHRPDAGRIEIGGKAVSIHSPIEARSLGIAVVHQHSTLVPALSVLENASLVAGGWGRVNHALADRLIETAESLGFEIDPAARVETLTVGQRQRVEIARALLHDARIVLLDEPTVLLAPSEQEELFRLLKKMTAAGGGVVLVTHRLEEARTQCDRLTVLRQGKVVGSSDNPQELGQPELVRMLVGDVKQYAKEPRPTGHVVLEARRVYGSPHEEGHRLRGIDLTVRASEVLGIAGVEGNGQRELAAALVGSWSPDAGSVRLEGQEITEYPSAQRSHMIADIPDVESLAVVHEMAVWENLALADLAWADAPTPRARGHHRARAARLVEQFQIKTRDIETPLAQLSGGNRRRVVVARELSKHPVLVVASYATKGLDVRSIEQVKTWIDRLASEGAAVVYIASELEELFAVADRIAVMARGQITGILPAAAADVQEIGRLMLADVGETVKDPA